VSRLTRLFQSLIVLVPVYFICASTTSAADIRPTTLAVVCRSDWANAFKPVVNNIVGQLVGSFVIFAVPLGIGALVLLVVLYNTRHRSTLTTFLIMVMVAGLAIVVWPGLVGSVLPAC